MARPKNGGGTAFHQVHAPSLHEAFSMRPPQPCSWDLGGAGSSGCLPDGVPGVKEKGRKSPGYMLMILWSPTCHWSYAHLDSEHCKECGRAPG